MTGIAICIFAAILLLLTLLPLVKLPHGAIRGPAFVRLQLLITGLISLGLALMLLQGTALLLATGMHGAVVAINALYIAKFTPLWAVQTQSAPADCPKDQQLKILTANIKLSNRSYERLTSLVAQQEPDITVVIEPDQDWITALEPLKQRQPHTVEVPLDTGYGMAIYSRLPLSDVQVSDRVTEGVPSIRTIVTLRSGDKVALYAVHPEPPIATHDTKGRDSEIALAGIAARDDAYPAIVTGDLNDVAWSTTTRRFQRVSGLLDPRVGRGFYNTFHAHYPLFRWPLDHLFHEASFTLVSMNRLPDIGSDHFPMIFSLALTKAVHQPSHKDTSEEPDVRRMIKDEQQRDREAIGTDWEDQD